MTSDYGTLEDLRARLAGVRSENDRQLVPIFGSGISNSVLPNVADMTAAFRQAMPKESLTRFDRVIGPIAGSALAYQNGASLLRLNAGEPALTRVIRRAVLNARLDMTDSDRDAAARTSESCRELLHSGTWRIPDGYKRFAQYFASLDGSVRGPIVTTNFDPLIELALEESGLTATPVPIPFNNAPSAEQMREFVGVPVLHIHGYWTSEATLSTIPQLTKDRPTLNGLLRSLVEGSIVLVLGYSGWEDAFMRGLALRLKEAASLTVSEMLWAAYPSEPVMALSNPTLIELDGLPGFNLYLGIDGHALFEQPARDQQLAVEVRSPYGFSRLPPATSTADVHSSGIEFVEGRHPTWLDAEPDQWPVLESTAVLKERVERWLSQGGGGGAVAIGPVGEGKSLAIRQVALRVSREAPGWTVLWREPGAPKITEEWLEEARDSFGQVLICADEADIVGAELAATKHYWGKSDSGVVFLLASNDRLWWRNGAFLRDRLDDVLFHGLTQSDAARIAHYWVARGVVPVEGKHAEDEYADRLFNSANAMQGDASGTLFGAVLDVRFGEELEGRIADLLDKLSRLPLRGEGSLSLKDVYAAICVMQHTFDKNGDVGRGASRALLSTLISFAGDYADGPILKSLGREAAITFMGERVYSRHSSIAAAAVRVLASQGALANIARLVARAGGRLRDVGGIDVSLYTDAYRLGRSLSDATQALAAGHGAIEGASDLLEPRVTMLSIQRRFDVDKASTYATALLAQVRAYKDYNSSARGYFSEFSVVAREQGQAYVSVGLAALALADGIGYPLEQRRAAYALTSLARSAVQVHKQQPGVVGSLPALAYVCMERIATLADVRKFLGSPGPFGAEVEKFRSLSGDALCRRLVPAMSRAVSSLANVYPQLSRPAAVSVEDLGRLVSGKR